MEQRCYLRYVDVFSPRPNFGALFSFINATKDGLALDFGIEAQTVFKPQGFRIERAGQVVWTNISQECLLHQRCFYDPTAAADLIAHMKTSDTFAFDFIDRHGAEQSLRWDLKQVSEALADLEIQIGQRTML